MHEKNDLDLLKKIHDRLSDQNLSVAVAESCTGGLLSSLLSSTPGSSKYFIGGVVSYANAAKIRLLNVKPETLTRYGAVSKQVAQEMCAGLLQAMPADLVAAVTGIAGPGGGSPEKPVGTVWICGMKSGIADPIFLENLNLSGSRDKIRSQTCYHVIGRILRSL